jgi:hypothetical protein
LTQPQTNEVEELLKDGCESLNLRIHPTILPFLTPMKAFGGNLGAYIAPINHNKVSTHLGASITSTMLGN